MTDFHVLIIDQAPLFSEARSEFERAYRYINEFRAELHRYEKYDLPAYGRWLHANFEKYLALSHELGKTLDERQKHLGQVREKHWERFFDGCTYCEVESESGAASAFRKSRNFWDTHVNWGAADIDDDGIEGEYGPQFEERHYQQAGQSYDDEEESNYSENGDATQEFEERFKRGSSRSSFGRKSADRGDGARARRTTAPPTPASEEAHRLSEAETVDKKIKDLYRSLVKKLHPDHNDELTTDEKSLWDQVQAAYKNRDVGQLELLLALSNVLTGRISENSSLEQLRRSKREVEKLVAPLRQKIEEAQRARAWNFSNLADKEKLFKKVERDFKDEIAELRQELYKIETQIERFSRPSEVVNPQA